MARGPLRIQKPTRVHLISTTLSGSHIVRKRYGYVSTEGRRAPLLGLYQQTDVSLDGDMAADGLAERRRRQRRG